MSPEAPIPPRHTAGLCLGAVQLRSLGGDVAANVARHVAAAHSAAALGVQWLVFPELSLCGYEPQLLAHCTVSAQSPLLAPLRHAAQALGQWITVGAALPAAPGMGALPAIGAFSFCPDGVVQEYRKHHLHPGETSFASPGPLPGADLAPGAWPAALAICADIGHASHAQRAAEAGARVYAAGVLESPSGYAQDAEHMAHYARRWQLVTLMANHAGPSGPYQSAGGSALWDAQGLLHQAPTQGEYMVWARWDAQEQYQAGGVHPLALP